MADNYFGITDVGRVRTNNEDAFIAEKLLQGRFIAACVIDGVGGYAGGEVAAATAKQAILDYLSVPSGDIITMMKEAFVVANEKIAVEKRGNSDYESMACVATLAMVDVAAKTFYYAHVGDTRLYLLRDNSLVKISKDQSFVGYLEDSGRLTEEEAMNHQKRNEINNALGFEAQLKADAIETGTSPFLPGDTVLLCSDGLSDLLTSSEMAAVLLTDKTLAAKGKELITRANEKGGKDNITVVLVRNNKRPVVQKATKPVATTATTELIKNVKQASALKPEPKTNKTSKRRTTNLLTIVLAVLSLSLAATVVVLLSKKNGIATKISSMMATQKNEAETAFQQALDTSKTTLVSPVDSLVTLPVVLTDTISIKRDSVHIQGKGMRFLKSPNYDGPAFALAEGCKYVLLENLTLENFETGVLVQNKALHLKNVRFIGCRVPVQSQVLFPDNVPESGTVTTIFTIDSSSR